MVTRIFFTKLVLAFLIGMSPHADAQIFDRYGIEVGPSAANIMFHPMEGDRWNIFTRESTNDRYDISVYGFAERNLTTYLTFTTGIGRVVKGLNSSLDIVALGYRYEQVDGDEHRVTGGGHNVNVRMIYLTAPMKLRLERPGGTVRPFLAGGLRLDVKLRQHIEGRRSDTVQELMDNYRTLMPGFTAETGILLDVFDSHRLSFSMRWNDDFFYSSIAEIENASDYKALNGVAEIAFGMTLNLD